MPSTITHTYIALDTLKKIKTKPKKVIHQYIEDYKTFAQGMDILYFYHIFLLKENKVASIGHQFHHYKTNDIFKYIIEYNKANREPVIFSFLAGLITHYVADSTFHPYVNFLANNDNPLKRKDLHFEIETFLDNYVVNRKKRFYRTFRVHKLVMNNKKNREVIKLLDGLFDKFFNYENMGKKYYHSIKEMRFVFKYLRYDRLGIKRKIYKLIDKNKLKVRRVTYLSYNFPLENQEFYLNSKKKLWFNIKNKNIISNESFDELYNKVIINATYIINHLYDYIYLSANINLDELLGNLSYSNGLPLN